MILEKQGVKGYGAVTNKIHLSGRQYGEKTLQGTKRKYNRSPEALERAQERHEESVLRRRENI